MGEVIWEEAESGDISSGDMETGTAVGLDRKRGSDIESALESTDEIEVCLVLKPDLRGRDGPPEAELVGVEGRTERPISRGLVGRVSP